MAVVNRAVGVSVAMTLWLNVTLALPMPLRSSPPAAYRINYHIHRTNSMLESLLSPLRLWTSGRGLGLQGLNVGLVLDHVLLTLEHHAVGICRLLLSRNCSLRWPLRGGVRCSFAAWRAILFLFKDLVGAIRAERRQHRRHSALMTVNPRNISQFLVPAQV